MSTKRDSWPGPEGWAEIYRHRNARVEALVNKIVQRLGDDAEAARTIVAIRKGCRRAIRLFRRILRFRFCFDVETGRFVDATFPERRGFLWCWFYYLATGIDHTQDQRLAQSCFKPGGPIRHYYSLYFYDYVFKYHRFKAELKTMEEEVQRSAELGLNSTDTHEWVWKAVMRLRIKTEPIMKFVNTAWGSGAKDAEQAGASMLAGWKMNDIKVFTWFQAVLEWEETTKDIKVYDEVLKLYSGPLSQDTGRAIFKLGSAPFSAVSCPAPK